MYPYILTTGTPVHVPPCCVPAHYQKEVERQLQDMLRQDIIEESCSPWMAPAIFVRKTTGELWMYVDYRSTAKLPKMLTPCHWWMKCNIVYLELPFWTHLTCEVNTGICWYIPGIRRRALFVQVQEWACISSSRCHLGWQALPVHFNVWWPKSFETYHLSPAIWTLC